MWGSTFIILGIFAAILIAIIAWDVFKATVAKQRYRMRSTATAYLMLLPAVLLAFTFILLPILYSLGYSFTNYYLLKPNDIKFVWFDNFKDIFAEIADKGMLYNAIINTAIFVVGVVPLQIGMALGLALLCNRKKRGVKIFKVCFFAPVVISLSVTSFLWLQILSPSETGLLNSFLALFGAAPRDWLATRGSAMTCIILLSAWQGCGYQMLIFLAGLSNVRADLYEAAALDGANKWKQFTNVTWPGIRSTFVYIIITVFIGACRIMTQPMLMTDYKEHTVTISYYMYQRGYKDRWIGLSSAVALLMTVVIGSITLIQRRVLREK